MDITLTEYEFWMAIQVAVKRQFEAAIQGRPETHGATADNRWDRHIEGACGEVCVARALKLYWNGSVNTYRTGGDMGFEDFNIPFIQVRTRSEHWHDLLVRKGDHDEDIFILVTGLAPKFQVVGWIKGVDAKQNKWLKAHGGREAAYFVPQKELKDITILGRALHKRIAEKLGDNQ